MLKRIILVAIFALLPLFAKDSLDYNKISKVFYLEALYGFGEMNHPIKGFIHEAQLRAIFPTMEYIHEIVARGAFSQKGKSHDFNAKYNSYEVAYHFGMRLDGQFEDMGMVLGSAYIGLGYQNATKITETSPRTKNNTQHLYIPIGFWGEDYMVDSLKLRYGINTKMIFMDNNNAQKKFKAKFLYGGRVYLGVGYTVAQMVDIVAQGYFQYNAPIRNLRQYGLEVGVQF